MALVLDTGVLLAALDPDDVDHARSAQLLRETWEPLVVPVPVIVELEYLIGRRAKPRLWLAFAEDVATGAYRLHPLTPDLVVRAARIQAKYQDLSLGLVDAAVFLTCVDLGERRVATLDRRHFSVLRTEDGGALELLPPA